MINRRSAPALHRACLHQRNQPSDNAGREFAAKPIENGHDSVFTLTENRWLAPNLCVLE
jgi:hypothetical protein